MDPTIKFDDFTEEEQALMKSAPYVMKPLQDWHFKDVLHFFKSSVTNDKACIKIISEREVDGALIASMNDKEMEAALSLPTIHVKKFKVKLKRLQVATPASCEQNQHAKCSTHCVARPWTARLQLRRCLACASKLCAHALVNVCLHTRRKYSARIWRKRRWS